MKKHSNSGYTLIELMVALTLSAMLVVLVSGFVSQITKINLRTREITAATFLLQSGVEELKGIPFSELYNNSPSIYTETIIYDDMEFERVIKITKQSKDLLKVDIEIFSKRKGSEIHIVTYRGKI